MYMRDRGQAAAWSEDAIIGAAPPGRGALRTWMMTAAGLLLGACSSSDAPPAMAAGNSVTNSKGGAAAPVTQPPGAANAGAAGGAMPSTAITSGAVPGAAGAGPANPQSSGSAGTPGAAMGAAGMTAAVGEGMMPGPPLEGMCPAGFAKPQMGENVDFPHNDVMRQFLVFLPEDMSTPRPVFVALTGTVESTEGFTVTNSGLSELTQKGWVVLAPVRACSTDAADASQSCNGTGSNGWGWRPWNEGSSSPMWRQEVGPDGRFLESMVQCAATEWQLDKTRLFVGGISSGGTFANRVLTFKDDFWAGGIPASGEWYIEGGSGLSGDGTMMNDPKAIPNGRCCPNPLKETLEPMIVISLWGGPNDMWMGLSNYRPTTQASSNYFSSKPSVVHVACSGTHGHFWPRMETGRAFNTWAADLLYSHPKGTDPAKFMLTESPPEFMCALGRYTDHYDE
jgi:hypothetical protein